MIPLGGEEPDVALCDERGQDFRGALAGVGGCHRAGRQNVMGSGEEYGQGWDRIRVGQLGRMCIWNHRTHFR